MKSEQISQLIMNSFDRCNQLLQELITKSSNNFSNQSDCAISLQDDKTHQILSFIQQSTPKNEVQSIVNEIAEELLEMIHHMHQIEEESQLKSQRHADNQINLILKSNNTAIESVKEKQESQKYKEQQQNIIKELSEQLLKEQSAKDEARQTLSKMEAEYKSLQRKMEIYFKRRIENIQGLVKNLQSNYVRKKEVDFQNIIKKLDKVRRKTPWRDHNMDLFIQEDKKDQQVPFMEGDGTSTPFSNYSGVLTTDYQLPIDSQLEKELNQGGYLEDLAFNSTSFNNPQSISVVSQLNKKQQVKGGKSQRQLKQVLKQYYDEIVQPFKLEQDQLNNEDNYLLNSNKQNIHSENNKKVQSIPFLLDQSQKYSSLGLQYSYNQDTLRDGLGEQLNDEEIDDNDYNDDENNEEENSLSITAKELILLQIYSKQQVTNSYALANPKHVQPLDIIQLITCQAELQQQDYIQPADQFSLLDILENISANDSKIQNNIETKRRQSKRKLNIEGLNHVQIVNNNNLQLHNLNLSALLEDEIEPMEEMKKQKINDQSKFSQLLADVSEIKINISQSKPSFSVQNSFNTPANKQQQQQQQKQQQQQLQQQQQSNIEMNLNPNNNLINFNNYLQHNILNNSNPNHLIPNKQNNEIQDDDDVNNSNQNSKNNNFPTLMRNNNHNQMSPNLVIQGIMNGESAVCDSIYDEKTMKHGEIINTPLPIFGGYESNNNFLLPTFDESKISRVFSSANNSFELNNDSKANIHNNSSNIKIKGCLSKFPKKNSKFKDISKEEFFSQSEELLDSSLKQEIQQQQQPKTYYSLEKVPDKRVIKMNQQKSNDKNASFKKKEYEFNQLNHEQQVQINSKFFNKKKEKKKTEKNVKKSSPNISFLLCENMNVSEIRKKNNQDDDLQQMSTINDAINNNLNILSRDEKLFNDSKNNLSEFLDQFNSNIDHQRNNNNNLMNINPVANSFSEIQEEPKKHCTDVLDQLSCISDQEFNEQNSLKSPLKETVHLRFDLYDKQLNINFIDLLNSKNIDNEQDALLTSNQNTISNRNNQQLSEEIQKIVTNSTNSNEKTTQRQSYQKDSDRKVLSLSLCSSPQSKPKRFISVYEQSTQENNKVENQPEQQYENKNLLKKLKNQINEKDVQITQKEEKGQEIQKSVIPKQIQKLAIQKIFSSAPSSSQRLQLTKVQSAPFLEDENSIFSNLSRKHNMSPLRNFKKTNIQNLKNGVYFRPTELNYLHKPIGQVKTLSMNSPPIERINDDHLIYLQTPNRMQLQIQQESQGNTNLNENNLLSSNQEILNSSTKKSQETHNNSEKKRSSNPTQRPPSYDNTYYQYIKKSFSSNTSDAKFSEEKQKILHIIQKKLDLVQTRDFHLNIQSGNEYKQSKILMGNPFHKRQRNSFHEQISAISFSQKSSMQSFSGIQQHMNLNSLQNLSSHINQDNRINIKEKLLLNYTESMVEAAKRYISSSPLKKSVSQIKEFKIKDSPLIIAMQRQRKKNSNSPQPNY